MAAWLATAVAFNPMTYVLEAMRSLAVTGWDVATVAAGAAVIAAVGAVPLTGCLLALRARPLIPGPSSTLLPSKPSPRLRPAGYRAWSAAPMGVRNRHHV